MPAYNVEAYVSEAINSILQQTYTNFEFIIIDDGSSDNTVENIKKFDDSRIIFIKNKINIGLISSLNNAIQKAQGKYIARMDADDTCSPNRLEIQIDYMEAHPDISILGTNMSYMTEEFITDFPESYDDLKIKFMEGNKMSHPTVMMRKEDLFAKQLIYNKDYPSAEDYKIWTDAIISGLKIENIPDVLYQYRTHAQQTTILKSNQQNYIAAKIKKEYSLHFTKNEIDLSDNELAMISNRFEYINPPKLIFDLMYKLRTINSKNKFFEINLYNKYLKDSIYIYLTKKDVINIFKDKYYNNEFRIWILKTYIKRFLKNKLR